MNNNVLLAISLSILIPAVLLVFHLSLARSLQLYFGEDSPVFFVPVLNLFFLPLIISRSQYGLILGVLMPISFLASFFIPEWEIGSIFFVFFHTVFCWSYLALFNKIAPEKTGRFGIIVMFFPFLLPAIIWLLLRDTSEEDSFNMGY